MVTRSVQGAVLLTARNPAWIFKQSKPVSSRTGLNLGRLNLPAPWKLAGLCSSHSIASELNEFAVLYLCRLSPSDLILFLVSKLTSESSHVAEGRPSHVNVLYQSARDRTVKADRMVG